MPQWFLNPALTGFRAAVDVAYPDRDRSHDGTIGDAAHQATDSDHNPDADGSVDAWDMGAHLNGLLDTIPEDAIEHLIDAFEAHPSARYWIYNGFIASREWNWQRRRYFGRNPHTTHVHWNSRQSHENDSTPWEITMPVPTTPELVAALHAALREILEADTPTERQVRDMIVGGRQSPIAGRGLLSGIVDRIEDLDDRLAGIEMTLRDRLPAVPAAVDADSIVDLIAKRLADDAD